MVFRRRAPAHSRGQGVCLNGTLQSASHLTADFSGGADGDGLRGSRLVARPTS
jgi:hypothetical protein